MKTLLTTFLCNFICFVFSLISNLFDTHLSSIVFLFCIAVYLLSDILLSKLTKLPSWNPDPLSNAGAKELEVLSFLGPFFKLSIFAEDNVSMVLGWVLLSA